MNKRILELFQESPEAYVSGEEISRRLNVSRTAIWKHIEELRAAGYEFEAAPRKGYRLLSKPNSWQVNELLSGLKTKVLGQKIHVYGEVESTQTIAHALVASGAPEGTIVLAEAQTAGRGRMGRTWHSPAGKGIWMSLVLTPRIPVFFMPQLTLLSAVALCRSIQKVCQVDIGIKWPNDLLIKGKKVSGILLESSGEDERLKYVIAGIGISVNLKTEDYPEELRNIATSLAIESGADIPRESLVQAFLLEFEDLYALYMEKGFAPIRLLWEALSVTLKRPIRTHTPAGVIEGVADSLDDSGALTVITQAGEKIKIYSGDIELK
ncbi:BirA family biotin operon repressor/biotin-[acetyl-CoA-carboxylase] ligase [Paenibacillus sp. V4I3]|uniref:biotin--[acetyl-CoA-carboxylase] ligase n=1 Tax=unclassified Paenibacillus TaxID=185978 RepID=UPI00278916FB|nr:MULTISPECIES: biotin--[acetyl-CoA-carboxylase] ligase [unclassified Paenibacillus]MDQ0875163.1 BirA family biotin operon repressor/biotin-[acetyl-CoA-carboxylase] ligase [Paenibacillus sp. V4I3]MDQ0889105.1 BirA family biotin operon repressor/biotin-[acetyl-CoA-carboxylase] ligase [Paenibacillus sp. V4I9]